MFQKYYVVLNTAYCKTTRSIKIFDGKHLSDRNLLWIQAKATPMEQLLQSGNCFVFLQVKKIEKITLMQGACAWAVPWLTETFIGKGRGLTLISNLRLMVNTPFYGWAATNSRVGKGISAQAPHRTVLESLPSHGSSHSVEKELTT